MRISYSILRKGVVFSPSGEPVDFQDHVIRRLVIVVAGRIHQRTGSAVGSKRFDDYEAQVTVRFFGIIIFRITNGRIVRGVVEKILPNGVRIKDPEFNIVFLQKRETIELAFRATMFYREEYNNFIKGEVDHEMNPVKFDASGNKQSVAKPGDKRFIAPKKKAKTNFNKKN